MSENKKSPLGIVLLIIGLAGIAIVFGFYQRTNTTTESTATSEQIDQEKLEHAVSTYVKKEQSNEPIELDIDNLGTPRVLGDINAPVKISEHSSFTCGGCAAFHRDNFKKIKSDYINTGKAFLVYDDFPRNKEDIMIGAVARCVPDESYFNFVQVIFETQRDWIGLGAKYLENVKNTAVFAGGNAAKLNACENSEELQNILAERRDNANKTYGVRSTPTLVINDKITISGLAPYEQLKEAIEAELSKAQQ